MAKKRTTQSEHGEELALLGALKDDWENEAAWLALADWLENNGDPERGHVLRADCFRDSNRQPYDAPLPPASKKPSNQKVCKERTSDIDAVGLNIGHACGYARTLQVPHLSMEHLMSGTVDRAIDEYPRGWAWVAGLALTGRTTAEVVEWYLNWPRLKDLPCLYLWCHLSLRQQKQLANSPNVARVADVDFGQNYLTPEALEALVATPLLKHVSRLKMHCTDPIDGLRILAGASLPRLRRLTLDYLPGDPLGNEGAAVLAAAPWLSQLTHLHLERQEIGDEGIAALTRSPGLANVRILWLYENAITLEGARLLADSPNLKSLVHLQMMSNRCGKRGEKLLLERFGEKHCQA